MPDGAGGFTADPESVMTGATGLKIAADQLEDAGKELQAALAAQGECWGTDDSGKEFAKDYVPGAQGAADAFGSLVEGLRGLYKNVETAMTTITAAEDQAANTFTKGP
jgi:uncharacterized protein YukE